MFNQAEVDRVVDALAKDNGIPIIQRAWVRESEGKVCGVCLLTNALVSIGESLDDIRTYIAEMQQGGSTSKMDTILDSFTAKFPPLAMKAHFDYVDDDGEERFVHGRLAFIIMRAHDSGVHQDTIIEFVRMVASENAVQ